jgi:hypothetical protein
MVRRVNSHSSGPKDFGVVVTRVSSVELIFYEKSEGYDSK